MSEKSFERISDWAEEFKNFNNELEERILEANHDDTKVKWNKLLPDIMGAEVFIAGQHSDQQANEENGKMALSIAMIQRNGHSIIPFFTSPERLSVLVKPNDDRFDVMKVNTVRLFEALRGKHTVLNPNSPYSRTFTPFEMRILAAENVDKAPPLSTSGEGENDDEE